MKLAASIIFSLVAIATYASPAAYPEDQVDVQHSAINEPVTVHLEKRAGDQPGFMERISNIQKSVNYNHHQPGHQGHQGHRGYQGHQEYQEYQNGKNKKDKKDKKDGKCYTMSIKGENKKDENNTGIKDDSKKDNNKKIRDWNLIRRMCRSGRIISYWVQMVMSIVMAGSSIPNILSMARDLIL
ncbi:hypothetical protein BASA50_003122 [Batrachochytrium salamandrivorans]|uniref:Uncharacterized protein n=1 Tax=Batrachochytrium salamandrivorans TaxID=1357716 RepID=A0ABQ8FJE6_9FUNG|nr:hypothetical protein BASA50_003122 [Batrachochytrium salamandrivorans]